MDEQGVKNIIAESLRRVRDRWENDNCRTIGDSLRDEADRLSADKAGLAPPPGAPGPDFEGVKYVVFRDTGDPDADVGHCRLATRAEWEKQSPAPTASLDPALGPYAFVEHPNGVLTACMEYEVTPWHPQKGDKVRVEKRPCLVGTITKESRPKEPGDYYVEWRDGVDSWMFTAQLRPISFAPPEPEPEKPEFPNGMLVVNRYGKLLIALARDGRNVFVDIEGDGPIPASGPYRAAKDANLTEYVRRAYNAVAAIAALRSHAQHIAEGAT